MLVSCRCCWFLRRGGLPGGLGCNVPLSQAAAYANYSYTCTALHPQVSTEGGTVLSVSERSVFNNRTTELVHGVTSQGHTQLSVATENDEAITNCSSLEKSERGSQDLGAILAFVTNPAGLGAAGRAIRPPFQSGQPLRACRNGRCISFMIVLHDGGSFVMPIPNSARNQGLNSVLGANHFTTVSWHSQGGLTDMQTKNPLAGFTKHLEQ